MMLYEYRVYTVSPLQAVLVDPEGREVSKPIPIEYAKDLAWWLSRVRQDRTEHDLRKAMGS